MANINFPSNPTLNSTYTFNGVTWTFNGVGWVGGSVGGGSGTITSIVAGDNITVNNTDPANPIISSTGGNGVTPITLISITTQPLGNYPNAYFYRAATKEICQIDVDGVHILSNNPGDSKQIYKYLTDYYKWNGLELTEIGKESNYILSSTIPINANNGWRWLDLTSGIEYTYIVDIDSSQWVELGTAGISSSNSSTTTSTINSISINGTVQTIDSNKNVNLLIRPTTYLGQGNAEQVTSPISGNLTLKHATETVLSTALTNANSFTVVLPTPILGQINESVLVFKVGTSLPVIAQPTGLVWSGIAPTLTIGNMYTICYRQINFTRTSFEVWALAK